jgi:hypothetical protein
MSFTSGIIYLLVRIAVFSYAQISYVTAFLLCLVADSGHDPRLQLMRLAAFQLAHLRDCSGRHGPIRKDYQQLMRLLARHLHSCRYLLYLFKVSKVSHLSATITCIPDTLIP